MRVSRVTIVNVISLVSFLIVLFMIRFNIVTGIDHDINIYMSIIRNDEINKFMIIITDFGSAIGIISLSTITILFLLYEKRKDDMIFFFLSMLVGFFSEEILKFLIGRERPIGGIIHASGYSFPSGHATMVALLFLLLCYLYRKKVIYTLSAVVISLVGLSRIYLGVHWMSDVLGGVVFAIYILSISLIIKNIRKRPLMNLQS